MARLPFNPEKMPDQDIGAPARRERARGQVKKRGPVDPDAPSLVPAEAITVTALAARIKSVLTNHIPAPVSVVGEISNLNQRGHWFFSLKDDDAVIPCVMWASAAAKLKFTVEHGQQVVAIGRLDFYGPQGKVQLYVDRLEPVGQGLLEQRLRQLMETLREAGYFAEERKKALPVFPTRIAVITSETSAALQDVIRTTQQRWGGCQLLLVDARMQGPSAAREVARAIRWLGAERETLALDAIIVTRGGGSLEDLWAFNERIVADAIYHCPLPIVAAIGHETDTTIAELVADRRCSTPTQAVAILVPDARHERQRLSDLRDRLRLQTERRVRWEAQRLEHITRHPIFRQPITQIHAHRRELRLLENQLQQRISQRIHAARHQLAVQAQTITAHSPMARLRYHRRSLTQQREQLEKSFAQRLDQATRNLPKLEHRLVMEISRRTTQAGQQLHGLSRELEALNPRGVLQRGYTYTTTAEGKVIRSAGEARAGDIIVTHFQDDQVHSEVLRDPSVKKVAKKNRRPADVDAEEESGLFDL